MSRAPSLPNILGAAGLVTILACCAGIAGTAVAVATGVALTPSIALAAALLTPVAWQHARRTLGPEGPAFSSLVTMVLAGFVLLGAHMTIADPLVADFRCGLGITGLFLASPFVIVPLGLPVSLLAWPLLRVVRPLLRAGCVLVAGAALLLIGAAALRRRDRVEPREYIASLPVVADLSGRFEPVDPRELGDVKRTERPSRLHRALVPEVPGAPVVFFACEGEDGCSMWLRGQGQPRAFDARGWSRFETQYVVRHDARHDLFVIDHTSRTSPRVVVRRTGEPVMPLYPRDVRASLAAPRHWICGAALGLAVAALFVVRGAVARARAGRQHWREGFVTSSSSIVFADGSTLAFDPATHKGLTEGTSVTVASAHDGGDASPTFRTVPAVLGEVLIGSLEDRRRESESIFDAHLAHALATMALTVAPLLACAQHGIAFP